jgi:Flp pilus assembly protein TadG
MAAQQRPKSLSRPRAMARQQRGVYALEWAIIFPVFFALLYGIICYGLTFLVRESMQHAVEEGARAALQYPVNTAATWNERKTVALNSVRNRLDWLPNAIKPTDATIQFTVCRLELIESGGCDQNTPLNIHLLCDASNPCMVLVSYAIDSYSGNAIVPAIPGLGLILPDRLQASASILVDRRIL